MRILPFVLCAAAAIAAGCGPDEPETVTVNVTTAEPVPADEPALRMVGTLPGDLFPGIRATIRRPDGKGVREEPYDSAGRPVTVVIVNSVACSACQTYVERIRALEDSALARGADVVHVWSNVRETPEEKIASHAERKFRGGQVVETDAAIGKSLDVRATPTTFVVDAKGVIAYRGGIDDNDDPSRVTKRWLADAIDAVLAGRPVAVTATDPSG